MSYEIIYDKQFIDLKDGRFIPVILAGSNNCYDWNNKRSRSWSNFAFVLDGKLAGTLEEMESHARAELEEKKKRNAAEKKDDGWWEQFDEKNWGYWTSLQIGSSTRGTTFGMYLGLFRTGCKKALTVEQLRERGVRVSLYQYAYSEDEFEKKYGHKPWRDGAKTTEELITLLDKYGKHGSVTINANEHDMKHIRQKYFPKQSNPREKVSEYFYVYASHYGPVRKTTARCLYNSYDVSGAKKFKRESQANAYKRKLDMRNFNVELEVRKEESETYI